MSNIDPAPYTPGVPPAKSDINQNWLTTRDEVEALENRTKRVNILDFGGVGDNSTNNVTPIREAIGDAITAVGNDTIDVFFPRGQYKIGSSGDANIAGKNLRFTGEEGSELTFEDFAFTIRNPEAIAARDGAITVDANRGDFIITCNAAVISVVEVGMVITLTATAAADTQFGYPKADTSVVVEVEGNDVRLMHPLNFDYSAAEAGMDVRLRANPQYTFSMQDMTIRNLRQTGSVQGLKLSGLKSPFFRNIKLLNDFQPSGNGFSGHSSDQLLFSQCYGIVVQDVICIDSYIGIQVAQCRDTLIRNIYSERCHHPVVPASWSDNTIIEHLKSSNDQGGIESHPCFNVHYVDAQTNDSVVSNLRSVGGSLTRCKMRTDPGNTTSLFQSVQLVDPQGYDDSRMIIVDSDIDIGTNFILPRVEKECRIENSKFAHAIELGSGTGDFAVHNPIVRNVQCPDLDLQNVRGKLISGNSNLDALLVSGRYEIDCRQQNGRIVDCDTDHIKVYGKILRQEVANPTVITLRVYDVWFEDRNVPVKALVKLKASLEHSTAGTFGIKEQHYYMRHQPVTSSVFNFLTTPAFVSAPTGQANEGSFTMTAGNSNHGNDNSNDAFFEFDVTLDAAALPSPKFSLTYELEMWK